jgi:hypothetical protein
MVRIELAPEEAQELRFILETYLSDLRMEIRDTDSRDFRAQLKRREEFLKKVLQQLGWAGG